ncbi:glycosyltransferase family 2 protein [Emticicia sp. 17c]|uniref:glycosyltransferase family 2 protein n=1 Tax=Emticicia sp. 17c TaxID=3127704 RepID=UPI00301BF30F
MPSISVLMPVFNAERYVREAIESILNQTYKDFELIVLNDASTDKSKEIILSFKDPRIVYLENEKNGGLSFSRNRLLAEAKGEFIAWLDADDIAYSERLQEEVSFLQNHQDHAMVAGWARLVNSAGEPTGDFIKSFIPNKYLSALLLFVNYFVQSSVMIRKSCLPEIHYKPDFPPTEDYELWVRIAANYPVAILPKILVDYRIHTNNISSVQQQRSEQTVKLNHRLQLQNLGLVPDEDEINLHYHIAFRKADDMTFLQQTETWLQKISNQNKVSKRFDTQALNYILAHRWLKVCTSNKALGMKALSIYFRSSFASISFKNIFLLGKYILKG